jgi:hypothetical protein
MGEIADKQRPARPLLIRHVSFFTDVKFQQQREIWSSHSGVDEDLCPPESYAAMSSK